MVEIFCLALTVPSPLVATGTPIDTDDAGNRVVFGPVKLLLEDLACKVKFPVEVMVN